MNEQLREVMELVSQINSVDMLRSINELVVTRIKSINHLDGFKVKIELKVGDRVSWQSRRRGCETFGTIVKKNRTRAVVRSDEGLSWNVPFTMLSKVTL